MDSDHSTIISDSEPEGYPTSSALSAAGPTAGSVFLARAMREAAKQEAMEKERLSRRRTSDERPGLSAAEELKGKGKGKGKKEEVLVLSSGEDSAEEDKEPSTSRYFAPSGSPTGSKRRRVPSPNTAGEGWPSLASLSAQHRSPPRPAHSRTSSSSSSVQSVYRSPEIQRATTSGPHTSLGAGIDTRPSPAPFVSALDLLRSTPSQMEESYAEEVEEVKPKKDKGKGKAKEKEKKAPRPRPTVKKQLSSVGASKSKRRSTSVSSMEVIEETAVERDGTDGDEDDRRSVASTSSSTSTSALPAPSSWKERFQFGAKSSKDSLVGSDVKPKLESQPSQGGGGQRKKPWEDLETKIASRPRVKPPPAASGTTRSKVKRVVKAESFSLSDDDDEAVIVLDSTSTAFLPVPSPSTSPKRTLKKPSSTSKPTSTLSFLPAPLSLPADDRLRALTSCVLCRASWPTTKSLSVRQTHLRTCASKQLHTAETVALLVDDEILRLAEEAEERRREREEGLSLFDRAVGKGEGANAWREVTVVGVEEVLAGADQAEWTRKTRKVQEELDHGRRKEKVDKVVKVAKEVRRERAAAAAMEAGGAVKGEEGEEERVKDEDEGGDEEDGAAFPVSTGRLRPDSETSRAAVAKRASELLGRAGGTGLTQAPPRRSFPGEPDEEKSSKVEGEKEDDPAIAFSSPPRPTQSFQPSDLALRYESEGKADVVLLTSKPSRPKSPLLPLDDDEESGSLWKSAAGRDEDDEVVRRVVSPHLPPASPLASSPSLARSFTLHRHARTISAPSPGHQIHNDGDLGIGLSPSSNRLFSSLALSSSPSAPSTPGSPTRSTNIRPRARSLVHPYTPLSVHSFRSRSASPISPTRSRAGSSAASRRRAAGSSSPRTVKAMEGMGRLGLEEGDTAHANEEEDEEAGWRVEVEGWMLEGGASPGRGSEGKEMGRPGGEGEEEDETSEEEPLASATKRARSRNTTITTAHANLPPSSPSPAAAASTQKTKKPTTTASRGRKPAAAPSPISPAASDDEADDFAFHSDDSLPRPPPARRTSASKRTTSTSAAKPAPPPPADNVDLDPPGMPPYSTFTLSKLQKEVAKYGFRPSKEKSVMVEQMKGVWRAMNPAATTSCASASAAGGGAAGVGEDDAAPAKKGKKRTKAVPEEEGEEEVVPKSKAKPRGRKKKVVEADEDGGADEADMRTPGEKLRELILADEKLYCRILRYEPIHFDEFTALVKNGGVKIAQQLLMRCLDEQSITFYTQDPTNGSRRRYK